MFEFTCYKYYLYYIVGIIVIPGGAGGTILGGVLVKKYKMTCTSIMKWELLFTFIIMLCAFGYFIICDPIKFVAVNVDFNGT